MEINNSIFSNKNKIISQSNKSNVINALFIFNFTLSYRQKNFIKLSKKNYQ